MKIEIRELDLERLIQMKKRELELYRKRNEEIKMGRLEGDEKIKREILSSVERLTTLAETTSLTHYLSEWEIRLSERTREVPYQIEMEYRSYFKGVYYLLDFKKKVLRKNFGVYCCLLFEFRPSIDLIVDRKFLDKLQHYDLFIANKDINEERLFKVLEEEQKRFV